MTVKQGCLLAPIVFSLMFSAVLMGAYHDERSELTVSLNPTQRVRASNETFRTRISLIGRPQTQCTNRSTIATAASTTIPAPTSMSDTMASALTNVVPIPRVALLLATAISLSHLRHICAATTTTTTNMIVSTTLAKRRKPPNAPSTPNEFVITTPTSSDGDSDPTCPLSDRTFTPSVTWEPIAQ
nr:unnamed protein product [Spirometra erinaceieuropaei]